MLQEHPSLQGVTRPRRQARPPEILPHPGTPQSRREKLRRALRLLRLPKPQPHNKPSRLRPRGIPIPRAPQAAAPLSPKAIRKPRPHLQKRLGRSTPVAEKRSEKPGKSRDTEKGTPFRGFVFLGGRWHLNDIPPNQPCRKNLKSENPRKPKALSFDLSFS